ncbi:MAG: LacI family DNA-binding transcriptional regulator [Bryobacteraceae bacterium]|nr:LacI family DNA-binding transcriptional regulator [Bryobacteraceae bacterium]
MPKPQRKPAGRVTVRDVAKGAGVSVGAVSSVLSNRHVERRISMETVENIRAVALKLGYLPNISARRLRSGTSQKHNILIAFVTSYEAPLSLASHLIYSLRQSMIGRRQDPEAMSFSLMVEMFSAGQLKDMPGLLTGDHFNAAIITNTTPEDDLFLSRAHLPFPVVLVNRAIPRYSCVVEDPTVGGRAGATLLRSKRRNLAVLHGRPITQTTAERTGNFIRSVTEQLGRPPLEIIADNLSEAAAAEAMARFLKRGDKIDGLYAVTDGMALGAYHALKGYGLEIPRDVAVVGTGDYDISGFFDPPLSVVGVERSKLGEEACRLLLRQLEQPGVAPLKVEIPVHIILRASTERG